MEARSRKIFSERNGLKISASTLPLSLQPNPDCPVRHHLNRRTPSPIILVSMKRKSAQNQIKGSAQIPSGDDFDKGQSRFGCRAESQIKRHDKDFQRLWFYYPILNSPAHSSNYRGGVSMNWSAIQKAWENGDRDIAVRLLRSMVNEMRFEQKTLSCFIKNGEAGEWG